jgi:hypothetical protein
MEKLNHDNYRAWAFKMKAILMEKDVWNSVVEPEPEQVTAEWTQMSISALCTIALSVENSQIPYLRRCNTAKEAWEALKNLHISKTPAAQMRVMRQLLSTKLPKDGSMTKHLEMMMDRLDEWEEMTGIFDVSFAIGVILSSLNSDYGIIVETIESWEDQDLTLPNVTGRLVEAWKWNTLMDRRGEQEQGNQVESEKGKNVKPSRGGVICHFCRHPGHYRNECPKMRNKHMT